MAGLALLLLLAGAPPPSQAVVHPAPATAVRLAPLLASGRTGAPARSPASPTAAPRPLAPSSPLPDAGAGAADWVGGGLALGTLLLGLLGLRAAKGDLQMAMATTLAKLDRNTDPEDMSRDARSERERIEQRVVFNNERWRLHRDDERFARHLANIPVSGVIRNVTGPAIALSALAGGMCAAQVALDATQTASVPVSLLTLSVSTLALLLTFRTKNAYERWDGARKMIGLVKNRSEDLTRQLCVYFPEDRPELKEQMLRYIQAFFFCLKVHLRANPGGFENDENLIEDLTPILKPKELEVLLKSTNRPAHAAHCMTMLVQRADIQFASLYRIDQNLTVLADVIGGCERILKTPIPLSYTRFTSRYISLWLIVLPLVLSRQLVGLGQSIWLTPLCELVAAFIVLGIEEVAVQIEEPFSILPMEAYAAGSRANTQSIYAQMADTARQIINPEVVKGPVEIKPVNVAPPFPKKEEKEEAAPAPITQLVKQAKALLPAGSPNRGIDQVAAALKVSQAERKTLDPRQVVLDLQRGNCRFWMGVSKGPDMDALERRALITSQAPTVAILSCSDSRVPVEIVFDQGLGDVFVVRMAGNILDSNAEGSLEFAVAALGARVVLVMGHEACGAVKGAITLSEKAIDKEPQGLQVVLRSIKAGLDLEELAVISDTRAREREAIVRHTSLQVQKLRENPVMKGRLADGSLLVCGAFYEVSSGIVDFFSLDKNGLVVDL